MTEAGAFTPAVDVSRITRYDGKGDYVQKLHTGNSSKVTRVTQPKAKNIKKKRKVCSKLYNEAHFARVRMYCYC